MFNLFLMNLIVGLTSFLLVKYFFYFEGKLNYLITIFILYLTQIVISLQFLGIFNKLFLSNVILLNLFILLIVIVFVTMGKRGSKLKATKPLDSNSFINILSSNKVATLCLSIILGFGILKIFINLMNPPFGWDDLNYHFTFPVEWLKHGNLENPIVVSCDPSVSYYPISGSLFFLWFILPLKNVFLADLGQLPFFIIAFLALYSLARKFKLSQEHAFFSAALFSLVPNYFKQLQIAYLDIMVAALFLVALNYLFLFYEYRSFRNAILYSLTFGLIIGMKTAALPLATLLVIPFIYFCFKKTTFKKSALLLLISAVFIIATGGFSYIKNFIATGNPLYPLNVRLLSKVIFKGVIENHIYRTAIRPGDFSLVKILFTEGLGAQTVIFLLPAVFLGLPVAILKRKKDLSFNLAYFMLLPFLFILVYRFIIPLPNLRYIYTALGIGFIISFYITEAIEIPRPLLKTLIVICALASAGELAKRQELVASLILSFILFLLLPYLLRYSRKIKAVKATLLILAIIFLFFLVVLEKNYIKNEYGRYIKMVKYSGFWPDATRAWAWLNQNTRESNIAYIGRPVPFPLYGTNFKNNVYYVSVNKTEPAKLHYFKDAKYVWGYYGKTPFRNFEDNKNYRGGADYLVWLNNLFKKNTDYLFIYSQLLGKADDFPLEDGWAASHQKVFELLFKNETIHIYKIKK